MTVKSERAVKARSGVKESITPAAIVPLPWGAQSYQQIIAQYESKSSALKRRR